MWQVKSLSWQHLSFAVSCLASDFLTLCVPLIVPPSVPILRPLSCHTTAEDSSGSPLSLLTPGFVLFGFTNVKWAHIDRSYEGKWHMTFIFTLLKWVGFEEDIEKCSGVVGWVKSQLKTWVLRFYGGPFITGSGFDFCGQSGRCALIPIGNKTKQLGRSTRKLLNNDQSSLSGMQTVCAQWGNFGGLLEGQVGQKHGVQLDWPLSRG